MHSVLDLSCLYMNYIISASWPGRISLHGTAEESRVLGLVSPIFIVFIWSLHQARLLFTPSQ